MSDLFRMGPSFLGQLRMAGPSNHVIRPSAQRGTRDRAEEYTSMIPLCDPNMDSNCASMSGSGTHPFGWREDEDRGLAYCDPSVDPNCPFPLVSLAGGRRTNTMQTPPMDKCNPAWDPGCPRPQPNMTLSPYVPSSYLMGNGGMVVYQGSVTRSRPKDRSGRRLYV